MPNNTIVEINGEDTTFMRMKDYYIRNGQLKASYNLQFIVENYFIISSYTSNDRTDYNTLILVIKKLKKQNNTIYKITRTRKTKDKK